MTANLQERVNAALATIRNNRLGLNVLEAEMVRDVATTLDGKVRFTLLLAPSDEATIVRDVRQVVKQVDGVTDVRVDVKDGTTKPKSLKAMGSATICSHVDPLGAPGIGVTPERATRLTEPGAPAQMPSSLVEFTVPPIKAAVKIPTPEPFTKCWNTLKFLNTASVPGAGDPVRARSVATPAVSAM